MNRPNLFVELNEYCIVSISTPRAQSQIKIESDEKLDK